MRHERHPINGVRPEDYAPVEATSKFIEAHGGASLVVNDLTLDDLPLIKWAGNETHVRHIAEALERVAKGEVEYLAVRSPDGVPVSIGGIDYVSHQGTGTLFQLSTHESLQGLGLGTGLIGQAEKRIRWRGLRRAVLGVEADNTRALALYERLGYRPFGHEQTSWEAERNDGSIYTYVAECVLLEKELGVPS